MDLSKAFDTIKHDLLIGKLEAYGINRGSLLLMLSYLTSRQQRTKINLSFSEWLDIIAGVPQGSILGPILFNIFLNDIFLFLLKTEMCNYADDNTLSAISYTLSMVKAYLRSDIVILIQWFSFNAMALNPDKCQFICFGTSNTNVTLDFGDISLQCQESVSLLGITIDQKLSFDLHIKGLCKKASRYINIINRISSYLDFPKLKLLLSAYFFSQFSYCPLIWMFCSKSSYNRINILHERSLRILHPSSQYSFQDLLEASGGLSIHQKHLQILVKEIFNFLQGNSPTFMKDVFQIRENPYNLRNPNPFKQINPSTVRYGLEAVSYRGGQVWQLVPEKIRLANSIETFSRQIKTWRCSSCPCRLCKRFIQNLGFI